MKVREIKFRAWDANNNVMVYQGNAVYENRQEFWNRWENTAKISPPMQFTGLHDKNNNPIYEGDIIRISDFEVVDFKSDGYPEPSPIEVFEDIDREVVFEDGGFCFEDGDKGCIPLFAVNRENYEVIGNIYETP